MVYFLSASQKAKCPFSSFKGRPNYSEASSGIFLDDLGLRNQPTTSRLPDSTIILGSSVVFGGHSGKTLTELMSEIDDRSYYNCSMGSWNTTQVINQYMYNVFSAVKHCSVLLLCGYNDIFAPITYDPRPQYPYNFFLDEEISANIDYKEKGAEILLSLSHNINRHAKLAQLRNGLFQDQPDYHHHHALFLCQAWINSISVLRAFCLYHNISLHVLPQCTILDKKKLSTEESLIIQSSCSYYEIFAIYRRVFWKCVKANSHLFELPFGPSLLGSSCHIFTDQVHYTQKGYDILAGILCETLASDI